MTPTRIGIDTSVLVRLVTRKPRHEFERCVSELGAIVEAGKCEIFASNQVVGEAYVTLQHHYRVSKAKASSSLLDTLTSGLVAPLNGQTVIEALEASGGPGLLDRLIADDYSRNALETLTLDRRMASLPGVRRL